MLVRTIAAALAAALLAGGFAKAAPPVPGTDVYFNFTLIDPATSRRMDGAWIVVKDGRIASIGRGRPPAVTSSEHSHDLGGRYLLPGFIDAHAHITLSGVQKVEFREGKPVVTSESDDRITRHNARIALARGVTAVRNPGGDPVANARYDRRVASGDWIGPEAVHAGTVHQPPPFSGGMYSYPRTEAAWDADAAREAALGMKYYKLYTDLTEAEVAQGIQAAHRHGLKAIGHLNKVSWLRAAELGIDGLEHALPTSPDLLEPAVRQAYVAGLGPDTKYMYRWFELADYDGPLFQKLLRLLARRRIPVDLTFAVNDIVYNLDDLERAYPAQERADMDPQVLAASLTALKVSSTGWTAEDFRRARASMPKVLELARRLHRAGVPLMIGTDAGGGLWYGRELALHGEAGIPAWDVLRMATSGTASLIGMGKRIGRIKKGYEADLVVLDADPLADLTAADKVHAVINDGRLYLPAELRADAR
jgi:imidazolonepropionase-like amidohydrolase